MNQNHGVHGISRQCQLISAYACLSKCSRVIAGSTPSLIGYGISRTHGKLDRLRRDRDLVKETDQTVGVVFLDLPHGRGKERGRDELAAAAVLVVPCPTNWGGHARPCALYLVPGFGFFADDVGPVALSAVVECVATVASDCDDVERLGCFDQVAVCIVDGARGEEPGRVGAEKRRIVGVVAAKEDAPVGIDEPLHQLAIGAAEGGHRVNVAGGRFCDFLPHGAEIVRHACDLLALFGVSTGACIDLVGELLGLFSGRGGERLPLGLRLGHGFAPVVVRCPAWAVLMFYHGT